MITKEANAFPKKNFFIEMFTKDISLEDCILDLVDNSIDGLIRTEKIKLSEISRSIFEKGGSRHEPADGQRSVIIAYDQDSVSIHDKCGGIDRDYALTEALNFGHSASYKPGYFGVYGIGMKRALFKIGKRFLIESQTASNGFKCDLDVDKWLLKDDSLSDWRIPLQFIDGAKRKEDAGTRITITGLHDEVKTRMRDPAFAGELCSAIDRTYAFFLGSYVQVSVNDLAVKPYLIRVGRPKSGQASYEEFKVGDVTVRVLATVALPDDGGRYSSDTAGWYVVCNGRVILAADKSSASGWNMPPMGQFHSKYSSFLGIVFFESENPLHLPWTTTKRNLNRESAVYIQTKSRMSLAATPVLNYLTRRYPSDGALEPTEREISRDVTKASIGDLKARSKTVFAASFKSHDRTTTRVQYDAEKSDLERIRKHLRKPNMGAYQIGLHTFNYFLDQEGLK